MWKKVIRTANEVANFKMNIKNQVDFKAPQ